MNFLSADDFKSVAEFFNASFVKEMTDCSFKCRLVDPEQLYKTLEELMICFICRMNFSGADDFKSVAEFFNASFVKEMTNRTFESRLADFERRRNFFGRGLVVERHRAAV